MLAFLDGQDHFIAAHWLNMLVDDKLLLDGLWRLVTGAAFDPACGAGRVVGLALVVS